MTRYYEASPLAIEVMADGEIGVAAVAVFVDVWGI